MNQPCLVVGMDGSANADRALALAIDLALRTDGRLVLVHVFEPLAHLEQMAGVHDFAALAEGARAQLAAEWSEPARRAGIEHELRLVHGSPAEALLDVADAVDASFVVLGARGRGRLEGLLLGSTSSKAVQASRRPVIVVPPAEAPPPARAE